MFIIKIYILLLTISPFSNLGYHDKHQVVKWFWEAVDSFPNERRLRLLQVSEANYSCIDEFFLHKVM